MQIFGKDILLKRTACNTVDGPGGPVLPSVNIFVKVTKGCPAHCPFCSNASSPVPRKAFDIDKLLEIIHEIQSKGIFVNRVNITGGEPSVVSPLVEDILRRMSTEGLEMVHLHLNTNGLLPQSQTLMRHPRWNSISMSFHHYDPERLSELYGYHFTEETLRFEGIPKTNLNLSCNLSKGYIDSMDEAHRMLDFAIGIGVKRIGFVALMKVNEWCRTHFVDLGEVHLEEIPRVYFTGCKDRGENCKCSNYLYNKDRRILEIYMRNYSNPLYCESSLVYDGEFLRQGFHENNIIH